MPTSTGKIRKHQRVGVLEFTLKGQPLTLGAFVEAGADVNRLFVPFSDMTSGTETYAAGRYLELDRTSDRASTRSISTRPTTRTATTTPSSTARILRGKAGCRCRFARASAFLDAPGRIFRFRRRHRRQRAAASARVPGRAAGRRHRARQGGVLRALSRLRRCRDCFRRWRRTAASAADAGEDRRVDRGEVVDRRRDAVERLRPVSRRGRVREDVRRSAFRWRSRLARSSRRSRSCSNMPGCAAASRPSRRRRTACGASRRPICICSRWRSCRTVLPRSVRSRLRASRSRTRTGGSKPHDGGPAMRRGHAHLPGFRARPGRSRSSTRSAN